MSEIEDYIKKCKKDIACKFFGSDKFDLSYSQLHKLSDEIYNATKISLSHSTLKRIFKDNYSGSPQLTTLDAFAKYLGYTDWNEYLRENANTPINVESTKGKPKRKKIKRMVLFFTGIIALSIIFYIGVQYNFFIKPNYNDIEFSYLDFKPNEMPVVVHFRYNLKNVKFKDANIQPLSTYGWPNPDKIQLNQNDSIVRYIYQTYENFTPLLTIDGKIVKQLKLSLKTFIWKGYIYNEKEGFYIKFFDDKEIFTNGKMSFTEEVLNRNNFSKSDAEYTGFTLAKDFNEIDGNKLHFKTRLKNIPLARNEKSGGVRVFLNFENTHLSIPIKPMKAPFEEFWMFLLGNYYSSKDTDLSSLYCKLEEWSTIEIKTVRENFELYINDSLSFKTQFKTDPGNLNGIRFNFSGMGEVDYVRFYNEFGDLTEYFEFE